MTKLSIQAWMLVKAYWGIYSIEGLDYEKLRKITNPYICASFKNLCDPPELFYDYDDRGYRYPGQHKQPYHNKKKLYTALFRNLALGYKCQQFYENMRAAFMPGPTICICGCHVQSNMDEHIKKVDHIIALKSGKYNEKLAKKFKEDRALFQYLNYCGFSWIANGPRGALLQSSFGYDNNMPIKTVILVED